MIAAFVAASFVQASGQDTSRHVAWSGYVDTYFAYDFGRPANFDRVFTTQAARHDEFNINLAYVAAALTGDRIRGRIALQAGTSVQANYASEPAVGAVSGATLSRHIQEATAGARLAPSLWIDGGVYFSYIGWEGWISRDNPTYTRSLVAEYTPYYLSGVHLTWQPRFGAHGAGVVGPAPVTIQLHLMNGWQNVSENNHGKAVGLRVDWQPSPDVTLAYSDFIGNERPQGSPAATRVFNQLMMKAVSGRLAVQGQIDYGREAGQDWYGLVVIAHETVAPTASLSCRLERYNDPHQIIVVTGTAAGLETSGASLGLEVGRTEGLLWRTELRGLRATSPLFPSHGIPDAARNNFVIVTSLALTLQ
ncbi:MAG TPA: outer membrane beta-barrel protein [Gemmatimonadales bacterium]|nr:outer membrane beta-barrel protein [Gemmatimonadales bacterium]